MTPRARPSSTTPTPAPAPGHLRDVDSPVLRALASDHRAVAAVHGGAATYRSGLLPFAATTTETEGAWSDLRRLVAEPTSLIRPEADVPSGWRLLDRLHLFQMVSTGPHVPVDDEVLITRLGPEHAAQMAALAAACHLGTFRPAAVQLCPFIGVLAGDRLVAMAGTRFSTPYWREIASVGTLPEHRGQGLAAALVEALRSEIEASGRHAWLHVEQHVPALRLYERLGFTVHREVVGDTVVPE